MSAISDQTLKSVLESAISRVAEARDAKELDEIRVAFLGKKGLVTEQMKRLGTLPPEERKTFGAQVNEAKNGVEDAIKKRGAELESLRYADLAEKEWIDVTVPGEPVKRGHLNPISQIQYELEDIFTSLGFAVVDGPHVETEFNNFEALNIPKDHPARDMQDTFYFSDNVVLRTHTSPVQIRTMEKQQPPVRVICPGKVYRRDADITHSPMFMQIEGLWVDRGISLADLKGVLTAFVHEYFGQGVGLRFRPSFFPFTEPSAEIDIQCLICGGSGCRTCSSTGWLEILGAGMVDPELYRFVNYDSEIYTGFAFGMGIERVAMLRYGIPDIRSFYENDIRFLNQF